LQGLAYDDKHAFGKKRPAPTGFERFVQPYRSIFNELLTDLALSLAFVSLRREWPSKALKVWCADNRTGE
jgi:hypothetical protein